MKFGISLAGIYDSPNYLEDSLTYVKKIEDLGFDSVWVGDSQMLHRDAYCDLTLWSLHTTRLKLGPCVTNPYTRHPSVTATAICTIDEISGGRAALAIGTGDSAVRRIGMKPRPISELERSAVEIRNLCQGKPVEYFGELLRMRWNKGRKIPIYIAASGPKLLSLAGRVGDGAIVHTGSSAQSAPGVVASTFELSKASRAKSFQLRVRRSTGRCCAWFLLSLLQHDRLASDEPHLRSSSRAELP